MFARILTIVLGLAGFVAHADAQTLPEGCFSGSIKSFYHYYDSAKPNPVGQVFRQSHEPRTLCITAHDDAYIAANPAGFMYTIDKFVPRNPGVGGGYFSGSPIFVNDTCSERFEIRLNPTMRGIRYEQRVLRLCHDADAVESYTVFRGILRPSKKHRQ